MNLELNDIEHDLIVCALCRMRWDIDVLSTESSKPLVFNQGQYQACRFTTRRIDELLGKIAPPPDTMKKAP